MAAALIALSLLVPETAGAAFGDKLDQFVPSPSGNGRGIAISGNSTTAFYSTAGSGDILNLVNLKTHASAGSLDTNLDAYTSSSFGTLAWDAQSGSLWGSEYSGSSGYIDRIDPNTGAVTRMFNSTTDDPANTGIDGLSVDSDGSLWLSPDGLGLVSTEVSHYNQGGGLLGSFTAPFGNSGIEVDGDSLWLADIDNQRIHQYTKVGVATGVVLNTSGIDPEDLAIDSCSFAGRKALWTYDADFAGAPMAAYEIGSSSNAGCPADSSQPNPGIPSAITSPSNPIAGRPIVLSVVGAADSSGTLFTYTWDFDDYDFSFAKPKRRPRKRPAKQDKGRVTHVYECAGTYRPTVTVIDTAGARTVVSSTISVGFSPKDTKKHGSLQVSPSVRVGTRRSARIKLVVKKLKGKKRKRTRTKVRSISYKLDGRRLRTRRKASKTARAKLRWSGPHVLEIRAKFRGPRGNKRIKTCFQA